MPNKIKNTISIPTRKIQQEGGIVILPLKEYRKLQEAAIPTHYLTGRAAEKLDREVEQAMRDYRAGKTTKVDSLSEALAIYRHKKNARR